MTAHSDSGRSLYRVVLGSLGSQATKGVGTTNVSGVLESGRDAWQGPVTVKEPIRIHQRVSHQAVQASLGASRLSPRRAEAGNLKCVIEKVDRRCTT